MAKEKTYPAIANQNIKYDGKFINKDEKFKVKVSDVDELKQFAKIDIPEGEEDNQDLNGDGGQQGDGGGE
ncbi:hypothetical protein UT300005_05660 [Clostridium sp. CTA-5]